jgi:catechol 2,3-dioxygenase-like lactoylglutathione lyase family enzyme
MRFTIDRLDHLVITCQDLEQSASWYQRVLGMERDTVGPDHQTALKFGGQKINLHPAESEYEPRAQLPAPGAADLCFIAAVGAEDILAHLHQCGVTITLGPVARQGALGMMTSVYCRDPDGNLIEIGSYLGD